MEYLKEQLVKHEMQLPKTMTIPELRRREDASEIRSSEDEREGVGVGNVTEHTEMEEKMARGRVLRAVVLREREAVRYSVLAKLFLRRSREVWTPDLFRQRDEYALEANTERIRRRGHVSSNSNPNHGVAARVRV